MNERIKELRKALGLTLERFGEALGVGKTAINKIESGQNNVTDQMFKSICREFDVNEEWLRTGEGEMFKELSRSEKIAVFLNICVTFPLPAIFPPQRCKATLTAVCVRL